MYSTLKRWATPRNAFLALFLFLVNTVILNISDRPLAALAGGEPKLDLRFGYDFDTVMSLFAVYGERGRQLYFWNLVYDTPFPILFAITAVLFVGLVFEKKWLVFTLSLAPVEFMLTDLTENAIFFRMLALYPDISPGLVATANIITIIKRAGYYVMLITLVGCALIYLGQVVYRWIKRRSSVART
ncbi:MAG: hypothetical protein Kow00124_12100 [Anaerolineae bacterium]